jgi:hypothetical protein
MYSYWRSIFALVVFVLLSTDFILQAIFPRELISVVCFRISTREGCVVTLRVGSTLKARTYFQQSSSKRVGDDPGGAARFIEIKHGKAGVAGGGAKHRIGRFHGAASGLCARAPGA